MNVCVCGFSQFCKIVKLFLYVNLTKLYVYVCVPWPIIKSLHSMIYKQFILYILYYVCENSDLHFWTNKCLQRDPPKILPHTGAQLYHRPQQTQTLYHQYSQGKLTAWKVVLMHFPPNNSLCGGLFSHNVFYLVSILDATKLLVYVDPFQKNINSFHLYSKWCVWPCFISKFQYYNIQLCFEFDFFLFSFKHDICTL